MPREKLEKNWVLSLEWQELVAIILGSWIKWIDVFQLSKKVFYLIEDKKDLLKIDDLLQIKWIWKIKAMQIISLFELAKRYFVKWETFIKNIEDVLSQVDVYRVKKQEYFLTLTLDWANRLISKRVVSVWLLNECLIHPREVFADAIEERANSIIFVHNHPSWTCEPSYEDRVTTNRLIEASKILWIKVLDHVIITKDSYFSFRDSNLLLS